MNYQDYGFSSSEANHVAGYILQPLLSMLDPAVNTCILDVGCGNGWLVRALLDKGYRAYGMDASASGIAIAEKERPGHFLLQDVEVEELPDKWADLPFDTIVSTEVIEHLYSPERYFQFCHRILQRSPEGYLYLTTPYHGYWKNLILALTNKMDQHFTVLWEGGHIKFWSRKTLNKALDHNGFAMVDFKGCGRLPYLWKSMLVKAVVKR